MLPEYLAPYKESNLIRLGDKKDGGYIISKKTISKIEYLISFGLGLNWSFENDFFKIKNDTIIFCYDHTINSKTFLSKFFIDFIIFVKSLKNFGEIFIFFRYQNFFKKNRKHIKKRIVPNYIENIYPNTECINNIMNNKKNILLKIDVEGDEYRLFDDIINIQDKLNMLIIELHNIDLHKKKIESFILKLNKLRLIHTHGDNFGDLDENNDPTVIELTFLHVSLCDNMKTKNCSLPLENLDYPNKENRNDVKLNFKVNPK